MPGELGKCPTCSGVMSTNSPACPHCGENLFGKKVPDKDNPVVRCRRCSGAGRNDDGECRNCRGSGAVLGCKIIDLRTGQEGVEELFWNEYFYNKGDLGPCPRPTSWGPIPSSSGCLVITATLITLATSLLIAVLL